MCGADDEALAQMMEMGFSSEISRNALIITHGNIEEAINLLMTNPERWVLNQINTQVCLALKAGITQIIGSDN